MRQCQGKVGRGACKKPITSGVTLCDGHYFTVKWDYRPNDWHGGKKDDILSDRQFEFIYTLLQLRPDVGKEVLAAINACNGEDVEWGAITVGEAQFAIQCLKGERGPAPPVEVKPVQVWIDGSCSDNTILSPGGYGVVVVDNGERREWGGYLKATTNNRAELSALLSALADVPADRETIIHTDSRYTILAAEGIRKPKANFDLLEQIKRAVRGRKIRMVHVRGHAGDPNNERAHHLAGTAWEMRK